MLQILYTIRYFLCHSHVIRMPFLCLSYVNRMYSHVTRMSFVCHSYLLVCHLYVTPMCSYIICMYSYAIRMSLVCTRMSSVCHSYVIRISLVCHPHVTRIYSYAIRMSLVCHPYVTLMYSYAICMSLVCTLCHLHVTGRWFYHEPSLLLHMDGCESFAQSEIVSFLFITGSYFQIRWCFPGSQLYFSILSLSMVLAWKFCSISYINEWTRLLHLICVNHLKEDMV